MKTVNIHAAKTNLSKLIAEIESGGGDIVIARAGKPVARLTTPSKPARTAAGLRFGMWKDKIKITGDIVSPIPDLWEDPVVKFDRLEEEAAAFRPAKRAAGKPSKKKTK